MAIDLPILSAQQPIADDKRPTSPFLEFLRKTRQAIIDAFAAQDEINDRLDETNENLQEQVNRLTDALAGDLNFSGLTVGGQEVTAFLANTNGTAINDPDGLTAAAVNPWARSAISVSGSYLTYADGLIGLNAGSAGGVATLDGGGKVPVGQLPAIAITDVFVINSEAAQLALTAEEGDVAVRTDLSKSWIHNGGTAGTMADWQELVAPADAVTSVNGQAGTVTLTTADVAEGGGVLYFTNTRARTAISATGAIGYNSVTGVINLSTAGGWALPTGSNSRATFDTSTVNIGQLAQVVAAIVTDLYSTTGVFRP